LVVDEDNFFPLCPPAKGPVVADPCSWIVFEVQVSELPFPMPDHLSLFSNVSEHDGALDYGIFSPPPPPNSAVPFFRHSSYVFQNVLPADAPSTSFCLDMPRSSPLCRDVVIRSSSPRRVQLADFPFLFMFWIFQFFHPMFPPKTPFSPPGFSLPHDPVLGMRLFFLSEPLFNPFPV